MVSLKRVQENTASSIAGVDGNDSNKYQDNRHNFSPVDAVLTDVSARDPAGKPSSMPNRKVMRNDQ